jgi:predicted nuclease of restriction endonuclease-like RecB superfamily
MEIQYTGRMKKTKTRNKFEQRIERLLKRLKVSFKYESERIPYLISGHYIPDFIITTPLGKIYIETKGHFRPEAKRKMVAVKKLNPNLDIRLVFYSKKLKDIKWAEKNGFKWAIDTIPEEWLQ